MVLVHGGSPDSYDWALVMDDLGRDFRVYAPDIRGHGRSSWPSEHGFDLYAADLNAFVEILQLREVTLVGHSLGETAAMLAAQQQPCWLARLVLEEPMMLRPGSPRVELPKRSDKPIGFDWEGLIPTLGRQYNNPDPSWWNRLSAINVPTLVLIGGPHPLCPGST